LIVALCSTALVMICFLSGSTEAAERIAELIDSEPQLVKTISVGAQSISEATCALALSRAAADCLPNE
jgi:hypothetical protein